MGIGLLAFPFVTTDRAWLLIVPALVCGVGHALVFPAMTSLNLVIAMIYFGLLALSFAGFRIFSKRSNDAQ